MTIKQQNRGWIYEQLVANTLFKKTMNDPSIELSYWKSDKEEIDFVVRQGLKVKQLIQVCYEIEDYDTKKRELKSILKASKELKCNNLLIITKDRDGEGAIDRKKINYVPLWKWLLQHGK